MSHALINRNLIAVQTHIHLGAGKILCSVPSFPEYEVHQSNIIPYPDTLRYQD